MSDTVPNAFLLLLGQIGIFVVSLFFSLPLAILSGSVDVEVISISTWAFLYVVAVASVMMVANIMIGWNAVRYARQTMQEKKTTYSSRLFVADLLVIFVFFAMNNVIVFAVGVGLSAFDPSVFSATVMSGIPIHTTSMTLGVLMLLSAFYLYICKIWNKEFYFKTSTDNSAGYEKKLAHVIVIQLLLSLVVLLTPSATVGHFIICSAWLLSWLFVNFEWVSAGFVK